MLHLYTSKRHVSRFSTTILLPSLLFITTANAQENCATPQNIIVASTGMAHTSLIWEPAATTPALGYDWEITAAGSDAAMQSGFVQTPSLLIRSLSAETEYTLKVRAHCAATSYSDWVTQTLTTRNLTSSLTTQIGTGADANAAFGASYGPLMYAGIIQRNGSVANMLFTEEEMEDAAIPLGASITGVAFNKINAANNAAGTFPETRVRVLAANSATVAPLSMQTTLGGIEGTHTELMDDADYQLPDTIGWIDFNFDTPFVYSGQSLEIATVMYQNGQTAPFSSWIVWQYTSGFRDYMIGAWPINTVPLNEDVVLNHNNGGQYKDRPNMQIHYTVSNAVETVNINAIADVTDITYNQGTLQLSASVAPANASQTVVWEIISGAEYAHVNENGLVSAFADGLVVFRATSAEDADVYSEITITITNQVPCTVDFPDNVEPISLVQFAGIRNESLAEAGSVSPSHEDFTSLPPAEVALGQEYTITVKGTTNGNFTHKVVAYADWNKNNSFEDEGEMYTIGTLVNSTGTDATEVAGTIAIPVNAPLGVTKLRVIKKLNSIAAPCNSAGSGQAEDYSINVNREIIAGLDNVITHSISLYPNPATDVVYLKTEENIKNIELFNSLGQSVIKTGGKQVDLSSLNTGIYLLRAKMGNGNTQTFRIVKK